MPVNAGFEDHQGLVITIANLRSGIWCNYSLIKGLAVAAICSDISGIAVMICPGMILMRYRMNLKNLWRVDKLVSDHHFF